MAQEAPAEGQAPEAENDAEEASNTPSPESGESKTFDAEYVKSLRSENAQWRIKAQQAEERAQEFEDSQKSELEKAQSKASKEVKRAEAAEAALLRFQVAAEKQIPADALDLLTGSTREELEAKADKLLDLVKNRNENQQTPDFDGGAREPAPESDPSKAHDDLALALLGLKQ